jgi:deferrochelatase/peroxidase EfeB
MTDNESTPVAEATPTPTSPAQTTDRGLSRRRFLTVAAGAGAIAVAAGTGGALLGNAVGQAIAPDTPSSGQKPGRTAGALGLVDFEGAHQAGVTRPGLQQPATLVASFDVVAPDRRALDALFRELTKRSRDLAAAWSPDAGDPLFPPPESGVVGASTGPAGMTVTASVGASLFDDRYGLADRRPRQLTRMPVFANDVLDPDLSHGDLLLQISTIDQVAAIHALRYLQLGVRDGLRLRWLQEGFTRPDPVPTPGHTTTRNLLGFKDGTANPHTDDVAVMDELVWVGANQAGEPAWTTGGSYAVVRLIRMFVERWDRTALGEQEGIIGRTKRTGAPMGQGREEDIPDYAGDPDGKRIALSAHIRLANPRTAATERSRLLRRGYSYSRGFDDAGLLDQGLLFIAYQRDLEAGFATVQGRLDGEALEEYIRPVGGGYFFTLPGVTTADGYLGQGMLAG